MKVLFVLHNQWLGLGNLGWLRGMPVCLGNCTYFHPVGVTWQSYSGWKLFTISFFFFTVSIIIKFDQYTQAVTSTTELLANGKKFKVNSVILYYKCNTSKVECNTEQNLIWIHFHVY